MALDLNSNNYDIIDPSKNINFDGSNRNTGIEPVKAYINDLVRDAISTKDTIVVSKLKLNNLTTTTPDDPKTPKEELLNQNVILTRDNQFTGSLSNNYNNNSTESGKTKTGLWARIASFFKKKDDDEFDDVLMSGKYDIKDNDNNDTEVTTSNNTNNNGIELTNSADLKTEKKLDNIPNKGNYLAGEMIKKITGINPYYETKTMDQLRDQFDPKWREKSENGDNSMYFTNSEDLKKTGSDSQTTNNNPNKGNYLVGEMIRKTTGKPNPYYETKTMDQLRDQFDPKWREKSENGDNSMYFTNLDDIPQTV